MEDQTRNPYLAVNLSMFFPGLGQLYSRETGRGLIIIFGQIVLIVYGSWHFFASRGHVLIGLFLLFFAFVVHCMGLVDTYERLEITATMREKARNRQSPWLAFFFSQILPGIGHGYTSRWWLGLPIVITWVLSFRVFGGLPGIIFGAAYAGFVSLSAYGLITRQNPIFNKRLLIMTLSVVIVWFIRLFIPHVIYSDHVKPFFIPSESMEPMLLVGDRILAKECCLDSVHPGDIILFRLPSDGKQVYLKRLAAKAGDTVQILNGRLLINGSPSTQSVLGSNHYTNMGRFATHRPFVVPENMVFLLGDNSEVSMDSRIFGPVPRDKIIGKAYKIFWPPRRTGPL